MSGRSSSSAAISATSRCSAASSADGRDLDRLGVAERALREGGEPAQRLDLDVEQVHADRAVLGRRVDVEDAAAHRELAAVLDLVDALVARGDEVARDLVEVDEVADAQRTWSAGAAPGRGPSRSARPRRRRRPAARPSPGVEQRVERGDAQADEVRRRREVRLVRDAAARVEADGPRRRATRGGRRRGRAPGGRRPATTSAGRRSPSSSSGREDVWTQGRGDERPSARAQQIAPPSGEAANCGRRVRSGAESGPCASTRARTRRRGSCESSVGARYHAAGRGTSSDSLAAVAPLRHGGPISVRSSPRRRIAAACLLSSLAVLLRHRARGGIADGLLALSPAGRGRTRRSPREVVRLVNAYRAARGLSQLTMSQSLTNAAAWKASAARRRRARHGRCRLQPQRLRDQPAARGAAADLRLRRRVRREHRARPGLAAGGHGRVDQLRRPPREPRVPGLDRRSASAPPAGAGAYGWVQDFGVSEPRSDHHAAGEPRPPTPSHDRADPRGAAGEPAGGAAPRRRSRAAAPAAAAPDVEIMARPRSRTRTAHGAHPLGDLRRSCRSSSCSLNGKALRRCGSDRPHAARPPRPSRVPGDRHGPDGHGHPAGPLARRRAASSDRIADHDGLGRVRARSTRSCTSAFGSVNRPST